MKFTHLLRESCRHVGAGAALLAMFANLVAPTGLAAQDARNVATATPIKHVIIIIGENRTFDHLFATYVPKGHGQTISNLLSKGIVKSDGTPGPNYALSTQYTAQTLRLSRSIPR